MSKTKSTGNEKAKGTVRQQLWMAPLVLTVICLVTAALLGFTYQYTKPIIDESLRQQANQARQEVLPGAVSFEEVQPEGGLPDGVVEIYRATDDKGYAVTATAKGYGGEVKIMVGVDPEGIITGVKVTQHSETPGLGARIDEEKYTSQYLGKDGSLKGIESISGATISSGAFRSAVQKALDGLGEITGIGQSDPKSELFPDGSSFTPIEIEGAKEAWVAVDAAGAKTGLLVVTTQTGYNKGEMQVLTGLYPDGSIAGVRLLENTETEGLGTQVGNSDYTQRFVGLSSPDQVTGIENVTGASYSSKAFKEAVAQALELFGANKEVLS